MKTNSSSWMARRIYSTLAFLLLSVAAGCAVGGDPAEMEGDTTTAEEMVTLTSVELHGLQPATIETHQVSRALVNAHLDARGRLDQPEAAPSREEETERVQTAQQTLSFGGCGASAIWLTDGTFFGGAHYMCLTGSGTLNLGGVCLNGNTRNHPAPCSGGPTKTWAGHVRSYSSNNEAGFFSGNGCPFLKSVVTEGIGAACSIFTTNQVRATVSSCEQGALILTLGAASYSCTDRVDYP